MFKPGSTQDRRGVALVMTMMLMSLMIGASAFSVDFGRMMMYRTQLRSAADAAALAAAQQLMRNRSGTAAATGVAIGNTYKVGAGNLTLVPENFEPGTFNTSTSVFTNGSWNASANAVRVTVSYSAQYTLGRIFGASSLNRSASAIAMVGSVSTTRGVRPWVVSYYDMLTALDHHDGGTRVTTNCNATTYVCTGSLSQADIAIFSQMTSADAIAFLDGSTGPGGFGAIDDASGYTNAIANGGTSPITVGSNISSYAGKSVGQFRSGAQTLCGGSGNSFNCNAPIEVIVYDQVSGVGTNISYHVKYISALTVTHINATGSTMAVTGYFTSMVGPGTFSGTTGTVQRLALVK